MSGDHPLWTAVVLAAGRSSRMGPQHKLLEDVHGKPVIRHVVDHVLGSAFTSVVMVTGYRAQEVCAAAGPITSVHNPDYTNGLASSLLCGLAAVPPDHAGVFVILGDMPYILPRHFDAMIQAMDAAPEAVALVPVVGGDWAHPVALRRTLFADLHTLAGDKGARAVLKAREKDVLLWPCADEALLFDLDTPEALAKARALPADLL